MSQVSLCRNRESILCSAATLMARLPCLALPCPPLVLMPTLVFQCFFFLTCHAIRNLDSTLWSPSRSVIVCISNTNQQLASDGPMSSSSLLPFDHPSRPMVYFCQNLHYLPFGLVYSRSAYQWLIRTASYMQRLQLTASRGRGMKRNAYPSFV